MKLRYRTRVGYIPAALQRELVVAERIARKAHDGQKRWSGVPYIEHVKAVVAGVKYPNQKIVAWLHDVIEDTGITATDLIRAGISTSNVHAVAILTHQSGDGYYNYIIQVSTNPVATAVKIADLSHNLSDLKPSNRMDKYLFAKHLLEHDI